VEARLGHGHEKDLIFFYGSATGPRSYCQIFLPSFFPIRSLQPFLLFRASLKQNIPLVVGSGSGPKSFGWLDDHEGIGQMRKIGQEGLA
jgi:hypothetical protein